MAKKALCLSGGATRGTFQMGAIKCLYEVYGFRPDVIAGTSVGAINGIKLACAPPPTVNDATAILAAVSAGMVDAQLAQMRALETFWLQLNGRKDFFLLKAAFIGTMVEDALNATSSPKTPIGTQIDWLSVGLNLPLAHIVAAILATDELQKIKALLEKIQVEDAVATLFPVEIKLRLPTNINVGMVGDPAPYTNNLYYGTPLYMAMVALESGRLRYMTNRAELYERDGVTPVVTALLATDVALALDENLQPLSDARKGNINMAVARFQAAANQIAAYHPELSNDGTPLARKGVLAAATERARQQGNYWARVAQEQVKGVRFKTVVRDSAGAPDPIKGAIASASLPVLLEPPEIGAERYIDGGLREGIPIEVVLDKGVTQIVGILCGAPGLPATDSKKNVGLIDVGLRAAVDIAIDEITGGDLATAAPTGIETRIIAPTVDVHSGFDLEPSLIEISMDYGWLRAADEMQPVADPDQRKDFRQTSELIARLRVTCLAIEQRLATNDFRIVEGQKWDYFELRLNRWALQNVAARRTALGLPPHPAQATWSTDWEREFRPNGPFQFASVWSHLEVRALDGTLLQDLWPASSPSGFNPDIGSIEDAGSDRVYWMVRGAIFEDRSGGPLVAPLANFVVPSGLHQFLPRIPTGSHLMVETQAPGVIALVIGGKKYSAPTSQWIAAAGLTGAPVAIVPTGGLAQIPDGGIPSFLGSLAVVDSHDVTISEVAVERIEQSNTTVDIAIHNRSTTALTGLSVAAIGFDPAQGITVEDVRTSIGPNTIDSFTLRLQPTAAGVYSGSLEISTSDAVIPKVAVGMKLTVLPFGEMADVQFTPNPLTINAAVGSTSSYAVLALTNSGGVTPGSLSASFEPAEIQSLFNTGINLDPAAFTPGKSVNLPIFFYPTAAGTFTGTLVLHASGLTSASHPYQRVFPVGLVGNAGAATIRLLSRKPTELDFLPTDPVDIHHPRPRRDSPRTSVTINLGTIQVPVNDAASFFILNTGTLALEIPTMLGSFASAVSTQAFPVLIDPGKWVELHLDFGIYRAPGIGAFSETLRILCNDPVTPEAQVILNGAVGGAKASIVPEFIDFSNVGVNTAVQRTTEFQNKGTVDLHINKIIWRTGTGFSVLQSPTLPFLVPAGGLLTLNVEFGPTTTPGFYGDHLVLGTMEGLSADLGVQAKAH